MIVPAPMSSVKLVATPVGEAETERPSIVVGLERPIVVAKEPVSSLSTEFVWAEEPVWVAVAAACAALALDWAASIEL